MTKISAAEYQKFSDGLNGMCDFRTNSGETCDGCPYDDIDRCILSPVKALLEEHIEGE
jgi:hypothetical protein